jgi:uncharacterized protein YggE
MRCFAWCFIFCCSFSWAQIPYDKPTVDVSGDAEVKVVPDRVSISFAVETRNTDLETATSGTDAAVKKVMAAARGLGIDPTDIQTDFIRVEISYSDKGQGTRVAFYTASKGVQILLKDVSHFDQLVQAGLKAGANKIDDVNFRTSELRKYRDQARAMAVQAASEKAHDLAKAGNFHILDKPLHVSTSSANTYWSSYGRGRYGNYMGQNAVQNMGGGGGGGDAQDSVALGKISVTASVEMVFQIE